MAPSIAVIVCTLDRAGPLADVLGDLSAQLPDDGEVLVVDQSDDADRARQVIRELGDGRVRGMHTTPGLPAARNLGMAHTRAPILWFVDDDVRLHPGCLQAHLDAYADPRVGGVVGRIDEVRVAPNSPVVTNRVDRGGRVRTRLDGRVRQEIETLKGCNMSFRRLALERAGGFDPGFAGTAFLEDADASTRVRADGWRLRFEPAASLTHLSTPSGGVRQATAMDHEWWRFHNTGRFVRRHRGMLGASATLLTFGAIALERTVRWGRPDAAPRLLGALGRGWVDGQGAT